jgi:hypothetical protein
MRFATPLMVVFLAVLAVGGAADFWLSKDYLEWSKEEAIEILTDSPWACAAEVAGPPGAGGNIGSASGADSVGGYRDALGGGPRGRPRTGGTRGDQPAMRLQLRWASALPVRQAMARHQFGDEVATSDRARQMIENAPDRYILEIAPVPSAMIGGDAEGLKSITTLRIKGHKPIPPVAVQSREIQQGRMQIYLLFPKAAEGGHDITPEDKNIEIRLKFDTAVCAKKFKLKDMVYHGKLEI